MKLELYGQTIWLYRKAIDFRRSIDGLVDLVNRELKKPPQDGIYLFYNRGQDKLKCLSWHKNGFVLLYKRLEKGRFCFISGLKEGVVEMNFDELSWCLAGLEWEKMKHWRELNYDKFS